MSRVDIELDFPGPSFHGDPPGASVAFTSWATGGNDLANLQAIEDYVEQKTRETSDLHDQGKIPDSTWRKFLDEKDQWASFWSDTRNSWYISSDDMKHAAYLRDQIEKTLDPASYQFVHETSVSSIPAEKPSVASGIWKSIPTSVKIAGFAGGILIVYLLGSEWIALRMVKPL